MTSETKPTTPARPIVYVREADPAMLPDELQGASGKFFAVHDSAGNPLGLAPNRKLAFAMATRNNLTPVSVN